MVMGKASVRLSRPFLVSVTRLHIWPPVTCKTIRKRRLPPHLPLTKGIAVALVVVGGHTGREEVGFHIAGKLDAMLSLPSPSRGDTGLPPRTIEFAHLVAAAPGIVTELNGVLTSDPRACCRHTVSAAMKPPGVRVMPLNLMANGLSEIDFCVSCSASAVLVRLSFRSVTSLWVSRQPAAAPCFAKAPCRPFAQPDRL